MAREMRKRAVEKALSSAACTKDSDDGIHTKWRCPCGRHIAPVPRHRIITPGVVRNLTERMGCLPKGWLQ